MLPHQRITDEAKASAPRRPPCRRALFNLRILRESGFASVRAAGTRRLYVLDAGGLAHAESWLADLRRQWSHRLDALETEIARGRRRSATATNKEKTA
jgi:hypothetical protein